MVDEQAGIEESAGPAYEALQEGGVRPARDNELAEQRTLEFARLEEREKKERVRVALGKFNVFLHLTAWLSGCAYLLILGILMPAYLPYTFIPIGLWTVGLGYHAYRAFKPPKHEPHIRIWSARGD